MRQPILVYLPLITLLSLLPSSSSQIDPQTRALLQFKAGLDDPLNHLSSWTNVTSPCRFFGVRCDAGGGSGTVVTEVSLSNMNLSGGISPAVAALHGLTRLELDSNSLPGPVPPELGQCTQLRFLNLSYNGLTGELPDLSTLAALQALDVENNGFTGRFPSWVGNLSGLTTLSVGMNNYDPGETPASIGNLKNLTYLYLAGSSLAGVIPDSIFGLTALETLDMSTNNLAGAIPAAIGNLRNLWKIELFRNNLTGELPPELGKLTNLREIDVSRNQLSGGIPPALGALTGFTVIQLYHNNLSGAIPPQWGELRSLTSFSVYENRFSGEFPANFGRFAPQLNSVDISENAFTGPFPRFLCHGNNLQYLLALQNGFSGEFPAEYAACRSLQRFRINKNRFTGSLPEGIWGLPAATIIDVSDNGFTGAMSPLIAQAQSLNQLWLQNNGFTGAIPPEIGKLAQVQKLYLSNNSFTGAIPPEIGALSQLTALHLEENALAGALPPEIGGCGRLVEIDVSRNALTGPVPASLSLLASLNSLNLSHNELAGPIPTSLQALKLSSVDFSSNRLTGDLPPGLLVTTGAEAFAGNPGLCVGGRSSELGGGGGACGGDGGRRGRKSAVLVPVIVAAALVLVAGILLVSYRSFKAEELRRRRDVEQGEWGEWKLESFHPLELDADEICGVGEESLIGSGGTGRVYRLELKAGCRGGGGGVVAVKRLWKGNAARVMAAEMAILGKVRHRNILKLHACLSRGELHFIVYEYMPRGNLHQALRREAKGGGASGGGRLELDWPRRRRIAHGAAKGLMYLHHDCTPAIIHRDVKSTNILLDDDYEAKIADFGIAVAKAPDDSDHSQSTCFAGTHGYLAPELAYSVKVTEKTDVYSFGVVLLELVTGRSPINPSFGEGRDIVFWLSSKLAAAEGSLDLDGAGVLDPRVAAAATAREREDMLRVLRIAVLCTAKLPAGRPTMRDVVKMLTDAGAGPCSPRGVGGQPAARVCSSRSFR